MELTTCTFSNIELSYLKFESLRLDLSFKHHQESKSLFFISENTRLGPLWSSPSSKQNFTSLKLFSQQTKDTFYSDFLNNFPHSQKITFRFLKMLFFILWPSKFVILILFCDLILNTNTTVDSADSTTNKAKFF